MRRIVIAVLAGAALIIAGVLFFDNCVFVVSDVQVDCEGVSEDAIIRAAGINLGGRMRDVNTEKIALNVERTGEFECISVEKKSPSTLIITLMRRTPIAVAGAGGYMVLMDAGGYVMNISMDMPGGSYVYVTGLEAYSYELGRRLGADSDRLESMGKVVASVNSCGARDYVSELNVSDVHNLYIYSRTGIRVMLGDNGNMDAKITWMKYALIDLESRGETSGNLDVSSGEKADYSAN